MGVACRVNALPLSQSAPVTKNTHHKLSSIKKKQNSKWPQVRKKKWFRTMKTHQKNTGQKKNISTDVSVSLVLSNYSLTLTQKTDIWRKNRPKGDRHLLKMKGRENVPTSLSKTIVMFYVSVSCLLLVSTFSFFSCTIFVFWTSSSCVYPSFCSPFINSQHLT